MDSAEAVRRARTGDRDAFDTLYERYGRAVYLHVVGLIGDRVEAEDVLQTAFLRAWTHLPRLRREERFAPWLFRIATNAARDALGRLRERPRPLHAEDDVVGPDPAPIPDLEAGLASLDGLTPETRSLLLLRAVLGWSAEETAAVLGTTASTIRRKTARALEHLRARAAARIPHV